jgi:enhancing lycopene biosynthesis protein 2
MVKVGVVLSGCGYLDGAEIHEAVLTAYFLGLEGAEVLFCAPDVEQQDVMDHLTGKAMPGEKRNVLVEAARIARGAIRKVEDMDVSELDALALPGGFGAAKNLCDFAAQGPGCSVHPGVEQLVRDVHAAGLPIGAICIAPALIAKVLGSEHPHLTIGNDAGTAKALEACGAKHEKQPVEGVTVDEEHRILSTPAYMLGPGVNDVAKGIAALCKRLVAMARQPQSVH